MYLPENFSRPSLSSPLQFSLPALRTPLSTLYNEWLHFKLPEKRRKFHFGFSVPLLMVTVTFCYVPSYQIISLYFYEDAKRTKMVPSTGAGWAAQAPYEPLYVWIYSRKLYHIKFCMLLGTKNCLSLLSDIPYCASSILKVPFLRPGLTGKDYSPTRVSEVCPKWFLY